MFARKLFVGFLTLVLLARGVHCLYVDVAACAGCEASRSDTPPLSDPCDSDPDESGCLCKGALLKTPTLIAGLERQSRLISPAGVAPSAAVATVGPQIVPTLRDFLSPPPLSGRAVRAWIASWQI